MAGDRAEACRSQVRIVHNSPLQPAQELWSIDGCDAEEVRAAAAVAKRAWFDWKAIDINSRIEVLNRLSSLLEAQSDTLARQMALEIGKPVVSGIAEVSRAVSLLKTVASFSSSPLKVKCDDESVIRYCPLGTIAIITPWNNPLAIPVGKIAPALLYGNSVVWKPAPIGSSIAIKVMELMKAAGCPDGIVSLVCGDHTTAIALMNDPNVDAITISGSLSSGAYAQEVAARRFIPFQAEMGGNNASIVWADCNIEDAAEKIAIGAFGFAGQRCTANRRAIVDGRCYDSFLSHIEKSTGNLGWGYPLDPANQVGPVISLSARDRIARAVSVASEAGCSVIVPHQKRANYEAILREGAYYPPTVICCDFPDNEIVQEETFGPVLVVQRASDWDEAIRLCNGVRQGLVASLFSNDSNLRSQFLDQARCGILKLNAATADVGVKQPFGGWKASGVGPPEHGVSNREFYTRAQSVYL